MGRVHKKKLAEYAESNDIAESEKSEGSKEKINSESEGEEDEVSKNKSNDSVAAGDNEEEGDGEGEGEEEEEKDEDYKSLEEDNAEDQDAESDAGKRSNAKKRKSVKKTEVDAESDDEPLNGSAAKRGRRAGGKAKAGAKNGKAGGGAAAAVGAGAGAGRGKGKGGKKAANNDDEDGQDGENGGEDEEYEVKEIMDEKVERGVTYFLIRWKGYTKDDDSWEPADTLACPDLIEKFKKKKLNNSDKSKKGPKPVKKTGRIVKKNGSKNDPEKEWEVEKIIDYAEEKTGRIFRIRWKGFTAKYDTWEPEENLSCDEIISRFMKRMKSQEYVSFKELREEPKKVKRLVNETVPRTHYHNRIERTSKRATKKRIYYGDDDE